MKKTTNTFFWVLSALLVALNTGCSASKQSQNALPNAQFLDGLYVARPTVAEPIITILKLQNPALLETSTRKDGKLVIDQKLLKAIETEQADTIAALQKISPQIRVLIRYRLVLNGLAIWAPAEAFEQIKNLPNVIMQEKATNFARPKAATVAPKTAVGEKTSVNFIGSDLAHAQGINGEGLRVGIIDTGIDYTHKMLGGEGTEEAFKANNPLLANPAFPNKKVVGGIDLVGTEYNAASPDPVLRVPKPDANPIDEGGHGTHVAGTVAGIGDGLNTYSGVAPAADLYALKVFGANGSTSDEIVIAALEFAADPTGDLSFKEQLDVVNLSLGGGYGNPHIMYNHAITNLVRGGTIVVAAAGNSGDTGYIVGAPGSSDDAISVASSVDNQNQNVLFPAAEFKFGSEILNAEMIEGAITKPLAEVTDAQGELIFLGLADKDFDAALKEKVKGKVAFIDRGGVAFSDKVKRAAEAGAVAVIVANNADDAPFVMGGDGKFEIPGAMISKKDAATLKAEMAKGPVTVNLKTTVKIEKPWLADTMSTFSSRGPRSDDGLIKPEISAPGTNIISADMGGGARGVENSGTSMASPHIAGVMALLKQKHPTLSPYELKSVLMSQGKVIADPKGAQYSVSRQGAGRAQVGLSLDVKTVTIPSSLSLGITDLEKQKTLRKEIQVKNISQEAMTVKLQWKGSDALKVTADAVTLAAGESKTVLVTVKINGATRKDANQELDGYLQLATDKDVVGHVPVLAIVRQISQVAAKSLTVLATSAADSAGSAADLVLTNAGTNKGTAHIFNLLGKDGRKKDPKPDIAHNKACDLQSAGYRIVEKDGTQVLQVAVKLYEATTTWHACEVNVQIDADGNGEADQEIAGLTGESLPGHTGDQFVTLVLDGTTAREIRKKFEADLAKDPKAKENYTEALIDQREMQVFDNSTLAIIEADVKALAIADTGELNIKVSTTHQDAGVVEYDDYLAGHADAWEKISLNEKAQGFYGMPETVELKAQETTTLALTKGYGSQDIVVFAPQNKAVRDSVLEDAQSQVIAPEYKNEN
ncbi:MAG: S8 family serine peptidase [Bdellovibrio sp.]|nr:S8 family serine peptidase [Bdellovibrio sp.]